MDKGLVTSWHCVGCLCQDRDRGRERSSSFPIPRNPTKPIPADLGEYPRQDASSGTIKTLSGHLGSTRVETTTSLASIPKAKLKLVIDVAEQTSLGR